MDTMPPVVQTPQPPVQTPQPQPVQQPLPRSYKGPFIVVCILLVSFVIGTLGWFNRDLLLKMNSPSMTDKNTNTPSPTISLSSPTILFTNSESNIHAYTIATKEVKHLTYDASNTVSYKQPVWKDKNSIYYIRCEENASLNYTSCSLREKNLLGDETTIVTATPFTIKVLNERELYTGGDISLYSVNHNKSHIAYMTSQKDDEAIDQAKLSLHLLDLSTNTDIILDTYPVPAGRGGSLDDNVILTFSKDGRYLLHNNTSVFKFSNDDKGSLFIYDILEKKLVWSAPRKWYSFALWKDTETVYAKEVPIETGTGTSSIATIQLNPLSVTTKPLPLNLYNWRINEEGNLYGWNVNKEKGKGIEFTMIDPTTLQTTVVANNIIVQKIIDQSHLLVQVLAPCSTDTQGFSECGYDIWNGYQANTSSIYSLDTQELDTISTDYRFINNADVLP